MKDKIILAVDVDNFEDVKTLVHDLKDYVGMFKVGKQLFTSFGPKVVDYIHKEGSKIFLDLKYHDIPNTVAKAGVAASQLGVSMFNVHTLGGKDMMKKVADEVREEALKNNREKPIVLGVTILTSITQEVLLNELKINEKIDKYITYLACMAKESGLDGVVCSPKEIEMIKNACGKEFKVVTPGVRPTWASKDDQKRITTPKDAINLGADYMVIGRPITAAKDKIEAAKKILEEL